MMNKEEVLKMCVVEGNVVKLPNVKLDRKVYLEVSKALNLIGGSWKSGKIQGFVFSEDPSELLAEIATGIKRNLQKEFQFFSTPDSLADRLVELADIKRTDIILEPSAGQGAIIKAIQRVLPKKSVEYFELMPVNQKILEKLSDTTYMGSDFLSEYSYTFDKIIANPPFSKNQDIDHVMKMYEKLRHGGRIVSITSKHWEISNNKKEREFKNWLESVNAEIYDIENGSFKDSGTMVGGFIIVINK